MPDNDNSTPEVEETTAIISSPYEEPASHYRAAASGKGLVLVDGRRDAGYLVATPNARPHQDRGQFFKLPLANKVRAKVREWREDGYPGVTGVTHKLLTHWQGNASRQGGRWLFFCQLEAIETLIWLTEADDADKAGVEIPPNGSEFSRVCTKLATGTGKTVVMAMLIAWQTINRATYPNDGRFAKYFFIVTPGHTVRERLTVLQPSHPQNYYDAFTIAPPGMKEKLRRARVCIRNWHALQWETDEQIANRKGVDKRGAKSDRAYVREVLDDMSDASKVVVINDEAHHAWRVPPGFKPKKEEEDAVKEATKWVGGLERIHRALGGGKNGSGIMQCYDFSATPMYPESLADKLLAEGKDILFDWVVSDFGLSDAIESGLVKTPRIVVRDDAPPDAKTYKSRLYHIYADDTVGADLNRAALPEERLPDLVNNAYILLAADWEQTKKEWQGKNPTPPVMITVANRTETAARIRHAFAKGTIPSVDADLRADEHLLHIDSAVLDKAEAGTESNKSKKKAGDALREKVNTVGQVGKPGERVQNIISVDMLSEGWDARTVTHIMGLRAFSSQLLCEQVVGRGLRRSSYSINEEKGFFDPEYVNVFGVPFSFLPIKEGKGEGGEPSAMIKPESGKEDFEISIPNVVRVERVYKHRLDVDWQKVKPLVLDASKTIRIAEIAPSVDGQPDFSQVTDIDLEELVGHIRLQTHIFQIAREVFDGMRPKDWTGGNALLISELIRLVEAFIYSDKISIVPPFFNQNERRREIVIALNMTQVFHHFQREIHTQNAEEWTVVLDSDYPVRRTGDLPPWGTRKPVEVAKRSHMNFFVADSTWEVSAEFQLDRHEAVVAWMKNDHPRFPFAVSYVHDGVVRKYCPDFVVRMKSGLHLILEIKGQMRDDDVSKHVYMEEWVRGVNGHGDFGQWAFEVCDNAAAVRGVLDQYAANDGGQTPA